jgi:amino acid transporter
MATGNKSPSDALLRGVAVAVITFACFLHGGWRAGGIYFSNTLACLKVGTLLVVICCGLAAHTGKIRGVHSDFPGEIKASEEVQTIWSISNALLGVLFSYGGYNNANYALSEIKHPHHTLKFGAYSAVGLVSMLYILTIIAYSGALSQEEIATAGTRVARQFFKNVFERQGDAGPRAMSGLIALSSLGNLMVVTFVGSRVNQEIAKEVRTQ